MPQMAPMSWLFMFFMFSLSLIIFNMMNFYCFNKNNKSISTNLNKTLKEISTINWKW